MEYREEYEGSKYLYYVADDEMQFNMANHLWSRTGGTKFYTSELPTVVTQDFEGVLVESTFVVATPTIKKVRVFLGHGVSDKPIKRFSGVHGVIGMDYYFMQGEKEIHHFGKHGHQLFAPYDKTMRIGVLRADLLLNEKERKRAWGVTTKEAVRRELGIPVDREVVLFAPTFQTGSLSFYFDDLARQLAEGKYVFLIKKHDREMFFGGRVVRNPNGYKYKKRFQKKYLKDVIAYPDKNAIDMHKDPIKFIFAADYYMGDGSSLDADALFAGIPMIGIRPPKDVYTDCPIDFNLRHCMPQYEVHMDLQEVIEDAKSPAWERKREILKEKAFPYCREGNSIETSVNYLKGLVDRLQKRLNGEEDENFMRMEAVLKQVRAMRKSQENIYEQGGLQNSDAGREQHLPEIAPIPE